MLNERGPRDRLWHLASGQRGYFTAADALKAGYSYQAQRFHKQRGNWVQIDRGTYRFREYLDLPSQDTDHLVRWSLWSRRRSPRAARPTAVACLCWLLRPAEERG